MQRSDKAAQWALLLGNFVIGTGVLAPAGLINELSAAFAVDVATVGLLIAYGAAVLCIEAPLLAFVTNRIDRRALLTASLVLFSAGHLASGFASSFSMLLTARLIMIGAAAVFTPQAASALGLLVAPDRRAGAVVFIFLGWSLASAVGIPLASLVGSQSGWASVYFILAGLCAVASVAVFVTLPRALHAPPLSVAAWTQVLSRKDIWLLLFVTFAFVAGQFTEYPYIAAKLKAQLGASPQQIAVLLAINGLAGFLGATIAARAIDRLGAPSTATISLGIVIVGICLWAASGSSFALATMGLIVWGCAGGPAISSQQGRLIAAGADVSSASVALNTSVLYLGQALGTAIGGVMITIDRPELAAAASVCLILFALLASAAAHRTLRA
jgi:MFS transporter, DHA1 family, inner membrane transport protein